MVNHDDFEGRVALVTGGASGIGAAVVERLRAGGAEASVFDLSQGDDVRDSAQLNAAVERLPRLDVLVCCAGVGGDSLHTEDVTDEEWERVILGKVSQEHIDYMTARIPVGRAGEPPEVAALICWLASEEMSFSTGACFDISGGRATY